MWNLQQLAIRYKPSIATVNLIIDPQSSQAIQPTKTPEQMQAEAERSGWLTIWPEFSWGYPWFRMHVKVSLFLNGLDLSLHMGLSPFLPDEGVVEWSDDLIELFASLKQEVVTEMFIEVGGFIAMYFSARGLSLLGRAAQPWLLAVAAGIMLVKFSLQGLLLSSSWNDKVEMLASGIVNTILACLAFFKINVVLLLIESVAVGMSLSVASGLRWIGQKIRAVFSTVDDTFKAFRDWIDITELTGDAILAALSWKRFAEL